ncbi:glycine decarboxylase complex subunit H [Schizosaccharomyces japonicus yFS275]|uniref:Glycine cleavage system H protein n=1 Tax=Schizosaccharomyces japonicus (strain yFS275 / FY16936) TaxID=402676 RepID=B6K4S9_SCHJY|nr:glycine decarboxylase complex subunit H [Schizosaccharomyces japonicus yFS275]EEB08486.1 glycine decarboxylase complex subunit H [Schizosaccharomyces japonicus yFS275]
MFAPTLLKASFRSFSRVQSISRVGAVASSVARARQCSGVSLNSLRLTPRWYSTVRYTREHEWVSVDGDVGTVGITKYAADALNDVVFVELPEEGSEVSVGDNVGAVESVKSASDVYSPVSGSIVDINEELNDSPGTINVSPEKEGWLCKIKLSDASEVDKLLDKESYDTFCKEADEAH